MRLALIGAVLMLTYVLLTKPRSVLLLVVAALVSLVAARPNEIAPGLLVATAVGGALASGGANALNCYLDRDLDKRMMRTKHRPLPSGLITPGRALIFGLCLSVASIVTFAIGVNALSAVLALAGILYYVLVYTAWLKRRTSWNVVVGGVAGVLPVLIGSAAATGGVSWLALCLAGVIFLWTPAHFWSLALARSDDYARTNVPMLPVVAGEEATRRWVLAYAIGTVGLTLSIAAVGLAGWLYLLVSAVAGAALLGAAGRLALARSRPSGWGMYKASSYYLAIVLVGVACDRIGLGQIIVSTLAGVQ
jgi:protoheme IX farnesyltransferase